MILDTRWTRDFKCYNLDQHRKSIRGFAAAYHVDVVETLEVTIAILTVVVLLDLVSGPLTLVWPCIVADVAQILEVVLVVHVLPACVVRVEITPASIAL